MTYKATCLVVLIALVASACGSGQDITSKLPRQPVRSKPMPDPAFAFDTYSELLTSLLPTGVTLNNGCTKKAYEFVRITRWEQEPDGKFAVTLSPDENDVVGRDGTIRKIKGLNVVDSPPKRFGGREISGTWAMVTEIKAQNKELKDIFVNTVSGASDKELGIQLYPGAVFADLIHETGHCFESAIPQPIQEGINELFVFLTMKLMEEKATTSEAKAHFKWKATHCTASYLKFSYFFAKFVVPRIGLKTLAFIYNQNPIAASGFHPSLNPTTPVTNGNCKTRPPGPRVMQLGEVLIDFKTEVADLGKWKNVFIHGPRATTGGKWIDCLPASHTAADENERKLMGWINEFTSGVEALLTKESTPKEPAWNWLEGNEAGHLCQSSEDFKKACAFLHKTPRAEYEMRRIARDMSVFCKQTDNPLQPYDSFAPTCQVFNDIALKLPKAKEAEGALSPSSPPAPKLQRANSAPLPTNIPKTM